MEKTRCCEIRTPTAWLDGTVDSADEITELEKASTRKKVECPLYTFLPACGVFDDLLGLPVNGKKVISANASVRNRGGAEWQSCAESL